MMREAKSKPPLWRRIGRAVFQSRSVCPHCGAKVRQGNAYFLLACILIGLAAGMVGQHIVSLQWQSVIAEIEHDIEQPFPSHRSDRDAPATETPPADEP